MIKTKKKSDIKKYVCMALVALLLAACKLLRVPQGLTREGFCALCLFAGTILLWLGEVFPMWVSALLMYFLFPWYGVMDVSECYKSFGGSSCFFILATFAIAAAMATTSLPGRICSSLIVRYGGDGKKLVLAIMMATTALSMMMSCLAVVSIFIALVRPIIQEHCGGSKGSNLAKCLYLGLPIACTLGGFMALSSGPGNIVIADMLETYCGIRVSYAQWLAVGVPVSLLFKALAWVIIVKTFKPEPLTAEVIAKYAALKDERAPMDKREKKAFVIIIATIVCWLASSWIPALNTTVVAMIAMAALMLPGVDVLTMKQMNEHTQWGSVILLGTISGLVAGITKHGVPDWIVKTLFANVSGMPVVAVVAVAVVFMAVMRNFIPTGTAFVSFMALPMFGIAQAVGFSLPAMMFIVCFWSCVILLVPYDPIYFVGYYDGYYTTADTFKSGSRVIVPFIILSPIVISLLAKCIGL